MVPNFSGIRRELKTLKSFPFDQERKRMSTVVSSKQGIFCLTKGAPESVLALCTSFLNLANEECEMTGESRRAIQSLVDGCCHSAYRCLAICSKKVMEVPQTLEEAESGLKLIGIAAIRDVLRGSTKSAIAACQSAGIRIMMITGDHVTTARAIAEECGILSKSILTGSEIRAMSEEQLIEVVGNVSVVARSTPMDKHMIVSALQKRGEVVAVTGDGTNDVAALVKADVGLSMGKCGTELAKEASDIVILDDDFQSIVSAILWGRCIFNNVRKFLQFQLTANVGTLLISFLSAVVLHDTPFRAVQLLWVNLIMDSLGALALATSRPHPALLERRPAKRKSPLISADMIQNIAMQVLFQMSVVTFLLLVHPGESEVRSEHHYTMIFNTFVYCQMFNLVNARAVERGDGVVNGLLENVLFNVILVGIGVVEFCLIQFGGSFFSCVALTMKEQFCCLILGFMCIPYGFVVRWFRDVWFMKGLRKLIVFKRSNTPTKCT
jgi:Ca2+-transporting ATPase